MALRRAYPSSLSFPAVVVGPGILKVRLAGRPAKCSFAASICRRSSTQRWPCSAGDLEPVRRSHARSVLGSMPRDLANSSGVIAFRPSRQGFHVSALDAAAPQNRPFARSLPFVSLGRRSGVARCRGGPAGTSAILGRISRCSRGGPQRRAPHGRVDLRVGGHPRLPRAPLGKLLSQSEPAAHWQFAQTREVLGCEGHHFEA